MLEAIDHTVKSSGIGTIASGNTTVIRNNKTDNADAHQKQKENQQINLQKINGQENISQEFLNGLEKDFELIHNFRLKFTMHEATDRTMVKVISKDTGETIREVPSETILDIVAKFEEIKGILSNDTV